MIEEINHNINKKDNKKDKTDMKKKTIKEILGMKMMTMKTISKSPKEILGMTMMKLKTISKRKDSIMTTLNNVKMIKEMVTIDKIKKVMIEEI